MSRIKKILLLLVLSITGLTVFGQGEEVEMADRMRSEGRIYVVVAVILTILAGLILYLVRIDRKVKRFEKEN